jgi:hypothetical protein
MIKINIYPNNIKCKYSKFTEKIQAEETSTLVIVVRQLTPQRLKIFSRISQPAAIPGE